MAVKKKLFKGKKKKTTLLGFFGSFLGWLFVLVSVSVVIFWIAGSKPQGKLVCDTQGKRVSLTSFGYCQRENPVTQRKPSFLSFWKRILL
ncbi:MAG TPA: hypothetical protein DD400_00790 [Rhodospirillaceae bacterium]|nr:hypothetical protein [Rhodospirillaceae bacterium]